jgi:hypothetical protein
MRSKARRFNRAGMLATPDRGVLFTLRSGGKTKMLAAA